MKWKEHSDLRGSHATFSPSQSAWLRYEEEKLATSYLNRYRPLLGSLCHEYAETQIILSQKASGIRHVIHGLSTYIYTKYSTAAANHTNMPLHGQDMNLEKAEELIKHIKYLPEEVFVTIRNYINDAIGFKMDPEVILKYSDDYFGTADAISYRNNILRIHDLKTGVHPGKMDQLKIYVALFCLEYKIKPRDIDNIFLCIYQDAEVVELSPDVSEIEDIMEIIIEQNKLVLNIRR